MRGELMLGGVEGGDMGEGADASDVCRDQTCFFSKACTLSQSKTVLFLSDWMDQQQISFYLNSNTKFYSSNFVLKLFRIKGDESNSLHKNTPVNDSHELVNLFTPRHSVATPWGEMFAVGPEHVVADGTHARKRPFHYHVLRISPDESRMWQEMRLSRIEPKMCRAMPPFFWAKLGMSVRKA